MASRPEVTIDTIKLERIPGSTARVGTGTLYPYSIYVEPGIVIRRKRFARQVDEILADPRGWIRGGKVSFQRVEQGATTQIILARPDSVDRLCLPLNTEGKVSCCVGQKVVINLDRWRWAVDHWTGPRHTYRQMLLCHEIGHRTGHGHGFCPGYGKKAPVMQQQTYGLQTCIENSWPLDSEL